MMPTLSERVVLVHASHDALPRGKIDRVLVEIDAERVANHRVEALVVEGDRYVVDARFVNGRDHRIDGHVTEQRDLALQAVRRSAGRCDRR